MTTPKKAAVAVIKKPAETGIMEFDDEKVALLTRTICKGATPDERDLFIGQCKRTKLDPFSRQIWFIKDNTNRIIVQIAIDGFRVIAERSGMYAGQDAPVFEYEADGKTIKTCSVTVYRWHGDVRYAAAVGVAHMREFDRHYNNWKDKPHVMISKVAEAIALRKAFPNDLSGIYSEEEIDDNTAPQPTISRAVVIEGKTLEVPEDSREAPDFLRAEPTVEPIEPAHAEVMAPPGQVAAARMAWKAVSVFKKWSTTTAEASIKATLSKYYGVAALNLLTSDQCADFIGKCKKMTGVPEATESAKCTDCGKACEGKDAEAVKETGLCNSCVNRHALEM